MSTELAMQLVETLGLDFHLGSALMAIAEGDVGRAKLHIDSAARNAGAACRPLLPAPLTGQRHDDPIPDLQVVQRTEPFGKRKRVKKCTQCKEEKGYGAFKSGHLICILCEKSGGVKPKTKAAQEAKPKAATGARRGRPPKNKQVSAIVPAPSAEKPLPGVMVNGNYCMTRDEYHNHGRGSTDALYAKLRLLLPAGNELESVRLLSPTGQPIESVTVDEIQGN